MQIPDTNYSQQLLKEDAIWGEQKVIKFRWVLISVIMIFIGYIYLSGNKDRALLSLLLASIYIFYNSILNILLNKYGSATWIRFLSAFIDITTLSVHIYNYSLFFKPIAVTTAASTFLYPVLILLSVLRYDKRLVLFSTIYSIISFNVIYAMRNPYIESYLLENVASSNWAGQIYKSAYLLLMGYFLYSIPTMINRLNAKYKLIIDERKDTELRLALEKQKKKYALQRLNNEQQLNKILAEQKEFIEQQKEHLDQSNRTKDKLFSIIGHDLKSPFAAQSSIIELILADYSSYNRDELKNIILSMQQATDQGLSLLDNLLDWSKQQNNLSKHNAIPLRLSNLISDTIDLLSQSISHKEIKIINNVDPSATVYADVNMLKTILRNLLSNAIKYTDNNGSITISSGIDGKHSLLEITDTGIGMNKDQQARLFSIDNTISTPGTHNEPGTGLGLLLSKELAEKNNAEIRVESTIGEGSTFTIALPTYTSAVN